MNIPVNLGPDSYQVVIEPGCLDRAGELLDLNRRVMIVTDDGVPEAYAKTLAAQCQSPCIHRVPAGEDSKSLRALEGILSHMLREGFTRSDCVAAVGGGVTGDLAGFAAACYMRGVDFYNLPTTVLSQVDSSVGGKTAVNLDGIKNIVGAFYQPRRVLIDVNTLNTLPPRQVSAGLAEAVKMALTCDEELFRLFETGRPEQQLQQIIARSVAIKGRVVEQDEKEQGLRKILNFGHTIGHGIESVTGLYHGECVALGMLPMCGEAVRARLRPVLEQLNLPVTCRADPEAVYAALLHDKKSAGGTITVVRVEQAGSFRMEKTAPADLRGLIDLVVKGGAA